MCSPSGRLELAGAFHVILCILGRITVRVIRFKLIMIFFFCCLFSLSSAALTLKLWPLERRTSSSFFTEGKKKTKQTSDNISSIAPFAKSTDSFTSKAGVFFLPENHNVTQTLLHGNLAVRYTGPHWFFEFKSESALSRANLHSSRTFTHGQELQAVALI